MSESCPTCGAGFAGAADLIEHVKKDHEGRTDAGAPNSVVEQTGALTCAACGAPFETREALAAHNQSPHPIARPIFAVR